MALARPGRIAHERRGCRSHGGDGRRGGGITEAVSAPTPTSKITIYSWSTRVKVARAHAHVADARRDFQHKLSTRLIRGNQAVYVETLSVRGLARTRLAKSVHDAGWSAFTAMLEYKAVKHGRTLIKVHRGFPSSQLCSACGHRDGPKPLNIREWTCVPCGTVHDRDVNAARNILYEGRRINAAT